MAVEEVTVHRIDVLAHPQPGVGHAHARRRRPAGEPLERGRYLGRLEQLLELKARRRNLFAAAREPRFDQRMVVVARADHELAPGQRVAELLEERPRRRHRLTQRPVPQLEHVTEQHHAVGVGHRFEQHGAQLGTAQQVRARDAPQVQVGDDQRAHR